MSYNFSELMKNMTVCGTTQTCQLHGVDHIEKHPQHDTEPREKENVTKHYVRYFRN